MEHGASGSRQLWHAFVESNTLICREHYRLRIRITDGQFPATRPGQFIQLGCREPDGGGETWRAPEIEWIGDRLERLPGSRSDLAIPADAGRGVFTQPELIEPLALLRRPFSLAGRADDDRGTSLEIVHRVVGVGTAGLSRLKAGDQVDLIGPLGNAFTLPAGKSLGLLVGGGVGLPPMFYLAEALRAAGWDAIAFVGAMTRDLLPVAFNSDGIPPSDGTPAQTVTEFSHFGYGSVVTTNDGSLGMKGLITAGLECCLTRLTRAQIRGAVVFTCGPNPMMHAVAHLAAKHGVDCQVCMEQAMACGMGTCQSCIVKIEDRESPQSTTADGRPWRYKLTCTDGPVFDAKAVVW